MQELKNDSLLATLSTGMSIQPEYVVFYLDPRVLIKQLKQHLKIKTGKDINFDLDGSKEDRELYVVIEEEDDELFNFMSQFNYDITDSYGFARQLIVELFQATDQQVGKLSYEYFELPTVRIVLSSSYSQQESKNAKISNVKKRVLEAMKDWDSDRLRSELVVYIDQDSEEGLMEQFFDEIATGKELEAEKA